MDNYKWYERAIYEIGFFLEWWPPQVGRKMREWAVKHKIRRVGN